MLITLVLASVVTASSPAETVATFFQRLGAGDPRATELLADPASFEPAYARTRRTRCSRLESLELTQEDESTFVARAAIAKSSTKPGARPFTDRSATRVKLRRAGEGWTIESVQSIEREQADAIAAAAEGESPGLLAACGEDCRSYTFVQALNRRANIAINRQEYPRAGQVLDLGESIARELDDDRAIATILGTRSALARLTHQPELPVAWGEQSLMHAERSGDPDSIARALLRLGRTQSWQAAKPIFDRGFALADHVEDASVAALLATQLAWHADYMLQRRDALYYGLLALDLSGQTDDPAARISAEMNLGGSYYVHGNLELARAHYEAAAALARERSYTATLSSVLLKLLWLDRALGDRAAAEAAFEEAVAISDQSADDSLAYDILTTRALRAIEAGDCRRAEEYARRALALFENRPAHRNFAEALNTLALVALAEGKNEEALDLARQTKDQLDRLDPMDRPNAHQTLTRALLALGRIDEAIEYAEIHIASLDGQRANLAGSNEQKRAFYDHRAGGYLFYIELLVTKGDLQGAWRAAQRMRAQLVQTERVPIAGNTALDALEQRIVTLNKAIGDPRNARKKKTLQRELRQVRLELDDLQTRASATQYRTTAYAGNDGEAVPLLPEDMAVVEYVQLESDLLIFVVAGGEVHPLRVPLRKAALARRVERFVAQIAGRDQNYRDEARALYDLLLAPVERYLRGRTVAIVPHGELWRLPFHALRTRGGRHVAEEMTVFYAPSAALAAMRPRSGERRDAAPQAEVLAFANPRITAAAGRKFRAVFRDQTALGALPHAEEEVRALARIYGRERVRIYTGAAAREAVFKQEAERFRILHVATHGVLDDASPLYSAVLLTADAEEDGLLEAREILEMKLNADLAVLAACDTAGGALSPGEGVVGMSWALLLAGCPTVAVSQWLAESAATSRLMIRFHESLAAGRSPAAAMRAAQRALMRDPHHAHPFYWAAFVVLGAGHD
ncbi:MAG TPA: CHAT domain-containing protein [Thermoanaerobaculia bacterium]